LPRALPQPLLPLIAIAGIPVLAFASWWSFRVAQADLLQSRPRLEDVRRAVALTPTSATAHYNAANFYAAIDPFTGKDRAELQAAVALNPRNAAAWMALGLKSEMEGNNADAERCLLEAANIDHMFKPAWSLANFYARSAQTDKFWLWIRKCVDLLDHRNGEQWTYDPNAVFALCWNVTTDAAAIERLAIPRKAFILDRYLAFLQSLNKPDPALSIAARLYPISTSRDLPFLTDFAELLVQRSRGDDAASVWNALIARRLLPYQPLDPAHGQSLTNGDLAAEPIHAGFDWYFAKPAGIYEHYSPASHTIRFDIDGDEPEHCELLAERVLLLARRTYRFKVHYRTTDLNGKSGLHWNLANIVTFREGVSLPPFPAHDLEADETLDFETPRDLTLAQLSLRYDRQPGATRPKGSLLLGAMTLELLP
jgi:tetratricopeptide (TPR) repeat protein